MDYSDLPPSQLVDLLVDKTQRYDVIVALIDGLKHPNSKVRWWCIQLMDHIADERYLLPLLDAAQTDPTPKNRRHAIHAMTCEVCKPKRQPLKLDADLLAEIASIARTDSDLSVRETALHELEAWRSKAE